MARGMTLLENGVWGRRPQRVQGGALRLTFSAGWVL